MTEPDPDVIRCRRVTSAELEEAVLALSGIFWALNQLHTHRVADKVSTGFAVRSGIDELILAGQVITSEIRDRF